MPCHTIQGTNRPTTVRIKGVITETNKDRAQQSISYVIWDFYCDLPLPPAFQKPSSSHLIKVKDLATDQAPYHNDNLPALPPN